MTREWLSQAITGQRPVWPGAPDGDIETLVAVADEEGVCALLNEQISADVDWAQQIPVAFREEVARLAPEKALHSLVRERECRRVLGLLKQVQVPVLLLKGTALAYWAYVTPYSRERGDIDLLFRNKADVDTALGLLANLKFDLVEKALPGDLISFEVTARREIEHGVPLEIDLHWHLSNTPMFAFRFSFDELMCKAVALPKLAPNAFGLAPVPAYLHACMHRIQNITIHCENKLKWLYDLYVLGRKFSHDDWQKLATAAIDKKLAGVCVDGLLAAEACFGSQAPLPIIEQLKQAAKHESMDVTKMGRWFYIQRMNFLAYPSSWLRLRWLWQRLLPDIAYMKTYYGEGQGFWKLLATRIRSGIGRLIR